MDGNRWMIKFRMVAIALSFSVALNIGLIGSFVLSSFDRSSIPIAASLDSENETMPIANRELLSRMMGLSFPELATYLTNKERVEEGYAKRDLALSALVASHHFYLEKALAFVPLQRRLISLGPNQTVALYPGLNEEQYAAIIRFAYQEKWPLAPKGLFHLLKKMPQEKIDPTLTQAFLATSEFFTLRTLFQKAGSPQTDLLLLNLTLEGPWEILESFCREQEAVLDLSLEKRRSLLLSYLTYRSPTAACLLLQTDAPFIKNRFEDAAIETLLGVLPDNAPEAIPFCIELIQTTRSDAVLQIAAEKLYRQHKEEMPQPFNIGAVLARFAPPNASKAASYAIALAPASVPSTQWREHVVKEGETLWKIARQYRISLNALVESNAMDKPVIFPGMMLRIPEVQGTGSEPPR